MARVQSQRAKSAAPAADARRRLLTSRKKPAYQVVLEQVTQKYKKLIAVGCFQTNPPQGYTFIPAGDPQITNRCKQLARLDGAKVYIVSTSKRRTDLSVQVHRIGYHFPSSIVARACTSLGIDLTRNGRVLHNQIGLSIGSGLEQVLERRNVDVSQNGILHPEASQASIDTQAREAIKDLFPKIPTKDLHKIVHNAFDKDQARVGTAPELTLPRRVQLAVVAHIRHNYTDYDKLLRRVPYHTARAMVEQPSLDKLAEWRGDDEDHPNAVEDILREVIVIPDNDDDEEGSLREPLGAGSQGAEQGDIDFISNRTIGDEIETRAIDYGVSDGARSRLNSTESDEAEEVQFLGYGQYAIARQDKADPREFQRIGAHRQRAWEQARSRHRREPELLPVTDQRVREYEPLQPGRTVLNPINEPYPQPERMNHRQMQPRMHESPRLTYLERVTPIPVRSTEQETYVRRIEHPVQVKHQHVSHENYRLVKETYPKHAEVIDQNSKHIRGSDMYNGFKGNPDVQTTGIIREKLSPRQRPVIHHQETHFERALPSVEDSSHLQDNINSQSTFRQRPHFHPIDDNHLHALKQYGPLEPSGYQLQDPHAEQDLHQNPFKRRRIITRDKVTQKPVEPYLPPTKSHKTILVPIEEYNSKGNELQWSTRNQSFRNLQPIAVEDYSPHDHFSVRSIHDHKVQAPLFRHAEDNGNIVRFVPESSHHSQVLLSPGLSQPESDSRTFQRFEKAPFSAREIVPYGLSGSCQDLTHDKLAASQIKSGMNTSLTTNLVNGERRLGPPQMSNEFHDSQSRANTTDTYRRDAPRRLHETSENTIDDVQAIRQRRNLPLEESFRKINPVKEETSVRWREPPQSPGSDTDYPVRGTLYDTTSHKDVKQKPLVYTEYKVNQGHGALPTYHESGRQSILLRRPAEQRILFKDHNHIRKDISTVDSVFEANGLTHHRQGQRMFDKYTGREVIILE